MLPAASLAIPEAYRAAGSTQNVYLYGDQDYQVEYRYDYEGKFKSQIAVYIDNYNAFLSGDDIDVYFYFVNCSRNIDFTQDLSVPNDIYTDLCRRLTCVDHAACLEIDSFETYTEYFYQTDHHWNYKGAQKGYEDVIRLMLGENEVPFQPVEEVAFNTVYNGSYTKRSGIANSTEKFTVYRYDLPEKKLTVNGKKKQVGRQEQYFAGKYSKDKLANHYSTYYGADWGEVVFDTQQADRENLLILCNSFGCAVQSLISAHFNKTYVVDMRYYMSQTGKSMRIHEYLKQNKIDKVLILGDISYFLYGKQLH